MTWLYTLATAYALLVLATCGYGLLADLWREVRKGRAG